MSIEPGTDSVSILDPELHIISTVEREELFTKYEEKITVNARLNRSEVSYQANKKIPFYS